MAERHRADDHQRWFEHPPRSTHRGAPDEGDWRRGYDEAAHSGPPLAGEVARAEYHPRRYSLAGAGVRGYQEAGAGERWGRGDYDEQGGGYGREGGRGAYRGEFPVMEGDYAPPSDLPEGFGIARTWGRMGGWYHGSTGVQRRRGPKGYKRSDDRITEDICEHLMNIGDIDSSDVEIQVHDGLVKLEGTVPERSMKYEIEDIAATTLGVTDVENNLRVPRVRAEGETPAGWSGAPPGEGAGG